MNGFVKDLHIRYFIPSVVRFRHTGESARSEDDAESQVPFSAVRAAEPKEMESVALADGAPVPREFANPTEGRQRNVIVFLSVHFYKHDQTRCVLSLHSQAI